MKKIVYLFAALLVLIGGWLIIFGNPVSSVVPAGLLPSNSISYFEHNNGSESLKTFTGSRLGKNLLNLDLDSICLALELSEEQSRELKQNINQLISLKDNQLLHDIFGQQMVVAVLPEKSEFNLADPAEFIKKRTVLITKPKYSANLLEKIAKQFLDEGQIVESTYEQFTLKRVNYSGQQLSTVIIDGYFIVSYSEKMIKKCIDVYNEKLPSLAASTEIKKHLKPTKDADSFYFLSIEELIAEGRKVSASFDETVQEMFEEEFLALDGFTSASYYGTFTANMQDDYFAIYFDKDRINKYAQKQLLIAPSTNDTVSWVSNEQVAYYWANTLDFETLWQAYKDESEPVPELIQAEVTFQGITGNSVDEFVSLFNGEAAFFLSKSDQSQLIPVPTFMSFFKVSDKEKVVSAIDKVISAYSIPVQKNEYKGVSYSFWGPFLQQNLQPTYGIYKDYFFLANSPQSIQKRIDAIENENIEENELFKKVDTGAGEPSNSFVYARIDLFLAEIVNVMQWSKNMLIMQEPEMSQQVDMLMKHLIMPIVDGCSMYTETTSRSYFTEDSIIIESRTNIVQ